MDKHRVTDAPVCVLQHCHHSHNDLSSIGKLVQEKDSSIARTKSRQEGESDIFSGIIISKQPLNIVTYLLVCKLLNLMTNLDLITPVDSNWPTKKIFSI